MGDKKTAKTRSLSPGDHDDYVWSSCISIRHTSKVIGREQTGLSGRSLVGDIVFRGYKQIIFIRRVKVPEFEDRSKTNTPHNIEARAIESSHEVCTE